MRRSTDEIKEAVKKKIAEIDGEITVLERERKTHEVYLNSLSGTQHRGPSPVKPEDAKERVLKATPGKTGNLKTKQIARKARVSGGTALKYLRALEKEGEVVEISGNVRSDFRWRRPPTRVEMPKTGHEALDKQEPPKPPAMRERKTKAEKARQEHPAAPGEIRTEVVKYLEDNPGASTVTIADTFNVSRKYAAGLLKKMAAAGKVRSEPNPPRRGTLSTWSVPRRKETVVRPGEGVTERGERRI